MSVYDLIYPFVEEGMYATLVLVSVDARKTLDRLKYSKTTFYANINLETLQRVPPPDDDLNVLRAIAKMPDFMELAIRALEMGYPWDSSTYVPAASVGNTAFIKFAMINNCPPDARLSSALAKVGDLDLLEWVLERECPLDTFDMFYNAIAGTHLNILHDMQMRGHDLPEEYQIPVIRTGSLQMFNWIIENGISINLRNILFAVDSGSLEILKWFIERGAIWEESLYLIAAKKGHLNLIKFAYEKGYTEISGAVFEAAMKYRHTKIPYWAHSQGLQLPDSLCKFAVHQNDFELLKWLCSIGLQPSPETVSFSIRTRNLEMYYWLKPNYAPDNQILSYAVWAGYKDLLIELLREGFRWEHDASLYCAASTDINLLNWSRLHGVAIDERSCMGAAHSGNLEMLMYLRSIGCPWDLNTTSSAAGKGHLNVLRWAIENGCPSHANLSQIAIREGHMEILVYIHDRATLFTANSIIDCIKFNHTAIIKWAYANHLLDLNVLCIQSVIFGNMLPIIWAKSVGYPLGEDLLVQAASSRCPSFISELIKIGCPIGMRSAKEMIRCNKLIVLRVMHSAGFKFSFHILRYACEHARIPIILWLISIKCPDSARCFDSPIGTNNIAICDILLASGCKLDIPNQQLAGKYGNSDMLDWIMKNTHAKNHPSLYTRGIDMNNIERLEEIFAKNCPMDSRLFEYAIRCHSIPTMKWLREKGCGHKEAVCEFAADINCFLELKWLLEEKFLWSATAARFAATHANIEMLDLLMEHVETSTSSVIDILQAANHGACRNAKVDVLDWLFHKFDFIQENQLILVSGLMCVPQWFYDKKALSIEGILKQAIIDPVPTILNWLFEKNIAIDFNKYSSLCSYNTVIWAYDHKYTIGRAVVVDLIKKDDVDALKLVYDHRAATFKNVQLFGKIAIRGASFETLKWLHGMGLQIDDSMRKIAATGSIEIIAWIHANGFPMEISHFKWVIMNRKLDTLKWAHENGIVFDDTVCYYAAKNRGVHILEWAKQVGIEWSVFCPKYSEYQLAYNSEMNINRIAAAGKLAEMANLANLGWVCDNMTLSLAVDGNHLHIVEYILQTRYIEVSQYLIVVLIKDGNLAMLNCIIPRLLRMPPCQSMSSAAAAGGNLKIVKLLHSKIDIINEPFFHAAAAAGHFHLLKWACDTQNLQPWSVRTINAIAMRGDLEIFQWARQLGCGWDESTTDACAEAGHLPLLKFAVKRGCAVDKNLYEKAVRRGYLHILDWMLANRMNVYLRRVKMISTEKGYLHILSWLQKL